MSSATVSTAPSASGTFIARFGRDTLVLSRSISYEDALEACRASFPIPKGCDVTFMRCTWDIVPPNAENWASLARSASEILVLVHLKQGLRPLPTFPGQAALPVASSTSMVPPASVAPALAPPRNIPPRERPIGAINIAGLRPTSFTPNQVPLSAPDPPATVVTTSTVPPPTPAPPVPQTPVSVSPTQPVALPQAFGLRPSVSNSALVARPSAANPPPVSGVPPPYSLLANPHRKVTFEVSTTLGDIVTLSAKRSVRVEKVLDAACAILKLEPSRCRIHHEGRTLGHGDMDHLTLSSLDVDDGDQLGISWDDLTIRSEIWLRPTSAPTSPAASSRNATLKSSDIYTHVVVSVSPQWTFDETAPPVPVDRCACKNAAGLYHSKVKWRVRTHASGGDMILDHVPQPVPCLSWEIVSRPLVRNQQQQQSSTSPSPAIPSGPSAQPLALTPTTSEIPPIGTVSPTPVSLPVGTPSFAMVERLVEIHRAILMALVMLLTFISGATDPKVKQPPIQAPVLPSLPAPAPAPAAAEIFDPVNPEASLTDQSAMLVKGSEVEVCLRKLYGDLGVSHDIVQGYLSARLPAMVRHRYVALRILSSNVHSSTRISPEPEALVRAFLVYAGVPSDEIFLWPQATERGRAALKSPGVNVKNAGSGVDAVEGYLAFDLSWLELLLDGL